MATKLSRLVTFLPKRGAFNNVNEKAVRCALTARKMLLYIAVENLKSFTQFIRFQSTLIN